MKKTLLLLVVALIATTAKAQFYVGGTLGISSVKTEVSESDNTTTSFSIVPEVGYNFNKTWGVGANIGIGYTDPGENDVTEFSFVPYVRANFAHVKIVDFFADAQVGFYHSSISGEGDDLSMNGWGVGLCPGIKVNLNNHLQLIAKTALFQYTSQEKDEFEISQTGFAIGGSFNIGVLYNF